VIAVHDYGVEFHPEKTEIAAAIARLTPWRPVELGDDVTFIGVWTVP
jgi:hypothetical protein